MRLLKRLLINLIFILSQNMRFCCSEKSFLYSPLSVCNYYYYYSVFFFLRVYEWNENDMVVLMLKKIRGALIK